MRWKSALIIVVTNIFLMLAVSLVMEFNGLSARFEHLDYIISSSFESAILTSTASEELFTEKADAARMTSLGNTNAIDKVVGSSTLLISEDGVVYRVNPYKLAYYFEGQGGSNYDRMPHNSDIATSVNNKSFSTATAFSFLFGDVGSAYLSNDYSWAAHSYTTARDYGVATYGSGNNGISIDTLDFYSRQGNRASYSGNVSDQRYVRTDFQAFYDGIGNTIRRKGLLKVPDGSDWFSLNIADYTVLDQMGLDFGNIDLSYDRVMGNGINGVTDNMVSSLKIGKILVGDTFNSGGMKTYYYLTPYSLGVTYVPLAVLKPVTLATLESNIRLSLLAGNNGTSGVDMTNVFRQANGCVDTSIYAVGASDPRQHVSSADEWILNDGDIEYDLNTVQVKVEYFTVNMFGLESGQDMAATSIVTTRVLGAKPGTLNLPETIRGYYDSSTGAHLGTNQDYGTRIIARCSIRLQVHVPYKNPVFQLARFSEGDTGHYDIKVWDGLNGCLSSTEDGLWYEYTTYYCIAQ